MATVARPLASCAARWLYEQASAILELLKAYVNTALAWIDTQIIALRAFLAQYDIVAQGEEWLWEQFQAIIDNLRNSLSSAPPGPAADLCPEFFEYFMNPGKYMLDDSMAALNIFRERYKNKLSYMDEIDKLIQYWEQAKADLTHALEIIDDALYAALMREAAEVP